MDIIDIQEQALTSFRELPHELAVKRFMAKVEIDEKTECWLWTGSINMGGYGQFGIGSLTDNTRRLILSHRFSFEVFRGEIPAGYQIDHLCRVRRCANPNHLQPVTQQENIRRGEGGQHWAKKTHCPKSHPYSGNNLRVYDGRRFCRECGRIAGRISYWKKKALQS